MVVSLHVIKASTHPWDTKMHAPFANTTTREDVSFDYSHEEFDEQGGADMQPSSEDAHYKPTDDVTGNTHVRIEMSCILGFYPNALSTSVVSMCSHKNVCRCTRRVSRGGCLFLHVYAFGEG